MRCAFKGNARYVLAEYFDGALQEMDLPLASAAQPNDANLVCFKKILGCEGAWFLVDENRVFLLA